MCRISKSIETKSRLVVGWSWGKGRIALGGKVAVSVGVCGCLPANGSKGFFSGVMKIFKN